MTIMERNERIKVGQQVVLAKCRYLEPSEVIQYTTVSKIFRSYFEVECAPRVKFHIEKRYVSKPKANQRRWIIFNSLQNMLDSDEMEVLKSKIEAFISLPLKDCMSTYLHSLRSIVKICDKLESPPYMSGISANDIHRFKHLL